MLAWRDTAFAKLYATPTSGSSSTTTTRTKVPVTSFGLFAARDSATMYATFYLAPKTSMYLQHEFGFGKTRSDLACALVVPAAMQVLTAPLHIFAFDVCQRPVVSHTSRLAKIKEEMPITCFARCLRILPAFGLGSFTNTQVREYLLSA
jgi:hypothetical protein